MEIYWQVYLVFTIENVKVLPILVLANVVCLLLQVHVVIRVVD